MTELGGRVAVVSNDGRVHTFAADLFSLSLDEPLPSTRGEGGLAGLCLDDDSGAVFITFMKQDALGVLRNDIMRLDTGAPGRFALAPTSKRSIGAVFAQHIAAISHQVGPCVVRDGMLYVGVGDGKRSENARDTSSPLGKVLRLTLDGAPVADNPFYVARDAPPLPTQSFVYALGLRNPFSMTFAGDALLVGDNGDAIDRFVRVTPGSDFLYDGTDWSVGTRAELVVAPAVSPVQMAFLDANDAVFPAEHRGYLYVALAGHPQRKTALGEKGVMRFAFQCCAGPVPAITSAPEMFVRYAGEPVQAIVGLAFGDDGLYIAPLFPTHADGSTAILRVRHAPERAHPHTIARDDDVVALMKARGCFGCHTALAFRDVPAGPSLDRKSLVERNEARLNDPKYLAGLVAMRPTSPEHQAMRDDVRNVAPDQRLAVWLKHRIREPRFDDALATMPALGLSDDDARRIAAFLLSDANTIAPDDVARPRPWYSAPILRVRAKAALAGAAVMAALFLTVGYLRRRRARSR